MFLQFCYTHRIYCINHFKHHVSGFGQYLTRVQGTRSHRSHCGVLPLAHSAACLAPGYSRGLRPRETEGECVPSPAPRDPLLSRTSHAVPVLCWRWQQLSLHHWSPCPSCGLMDAATSLRAPPASPSVLPAFQPSPRSAKRRLEGTIEY